MKFICLIPLACLLIPQGYALDWDKQTNIRENPKRHEVRQIIIAKEVSRKTKRR
jgi:hypothetical protein